MSMTKSCARILAFLLTFALVIAAPATLFADEGPGTGEPEATTISPETEETEDEEEGGTPEAVEEEKTVTMGAALPTAGELGELGADGNIILDETFKAVLLDYYAEIDANEDEEINPTEAETVTELYISYEDISSLKGIEYFTALEYLDCGGNPLQSLDVSMLTSLIELTCGENRGLTELNVSGLTSLEYVDCQKSQLDELDVSGLTSLDLLDCSDNDLSSLDVSGLNNLTTLYCEKNLLESLNMSGTGSIETLWCYDNKLKTLDVSVNSRLEELYCSENQLKGLDLSANSAIVFLKCENNYMADESAVVGLEGLEQLENKDPDDNDDADTYIFNPQYDIFTITATAGTGGKITPSGTIKVNEGGSQSFTIEADDDYEIDDVLVDGVSQGATTEYIFKNVVGDHTIEATFIEDETGGGPVEPVDPVGPVEDEDDDNDNNRDYGSGSDDDDDSPRRASSPPARTPVSSAPSPVTVEQAAAAGAAARANGDGTTTAKLTNPGAISLEALRAMDGASDLPVKLQADSISGNTVDVRITLDPSRSTKDLDLSASLTNASATSTTNRFQRFYTNDLMTVALGQQDPFGQLAGIAAKLDPAMNAENLTFYAYDPRTNRFVRIANPGFWVDANGYVHFTTELGGNIIVSDGVLEKR